MKEKISFEEARQLANAYSRDTIYKVLKIEIDDCLDDYYAEGEACWVFYRKREIIFPPESGLLNFSYTVSKRETK